MARAAVVKRDQVDVQTPLALDIMYGRNAPVMRALKWCGWEALPWDLLIAPDMGVRRMEVQETSREWQQGRKRLRGQWATPLSREGGKNQAPSKWAGRGRYAAKSTQKGAHGYRAKKSSWWRKPTEWWNSSGAWRGRWTSEEAASPSKDPDGHSYGSTRW